MLNCRALLIFPKYNDHIIMNHVANYKVRIFENVNVLLYKY